MNSPLLFHGREQGVQRLGERGVGEDGVSQDGVRQVAHHGYLDHRHDLTSLYSQHRAAQYPVRLRVDDGLHEAACLAHLYGPRYVAHRNFGDEHVAALVPGLLLAPADAAELRVYEHGVGDETVRDGGAPALQQIGAYDAEIVVGDVGKRRAAFHVSDGVDALHAGLQALVRLYKAAFVLHYSGRLEVERLRVGRSARSYEEVRAFQRALALGRVHRQQDLTVILRGTVGLSVQQDFYAVLAHDVRDRFGYVRVFAAHQLAAPLHYGYLAAEAPEHLGELQPDVAAAEHEQVLR